MKLRDLINLLERVARLGSSNFEVYINGTKITNDNIRVEVPSKPNRVLILTNKD